MDETGIGPGAGPVVAAAFGNAVTAFENPGVLSLDDILGVEDVEYREVPVKNWPKVGQTGIVRLATCSAEDLIEWSEDNEKDRKTAGLRLLAKSMVDKDGRRFVSVPGVVDRLLASLSKRSSAAINTLVTEALDLNQLTDKAQAAAKNA